MNPRLIRQKYEAAAKARRIAYQGPALVAARKAMGLTQAQLAGHMKVGERTLHRWENEGLKPGPEAVLYGLILAGLWTPG